MPELHALSDRSAAPHLLHPCRLIDTQRAHTKTIYHDGDSLWESDLRSAADRRTSS